LDFARTFASIILRHGRIGEYSLASIDLSKNFLRD
jgi:hypothetical protein